MGTSPATEGATVAHAPRVGIVDVDVHPAPRNMDEIRERMDRPFDERFRGARRAFYSNPVHADRLDSIPPDGPPGSDPAFMREQLIDEYGVAYAILFPRTFCNTYPDPDQGAAIAAAYNQWLADKWLAPDVNPDGAFKGSITVAHQDPLLAAAEIDKWAQHPHMVQVAMDSGARAPFGQRQYYPIYEACERNGLPLGIHIGTDGMGINIQPSPGMPTHYVEYHCTLSAGFQAHLVSFLTEGVFERFPRFKVALLEGGVAWLAPLMWRLDSYWRALRSEIPWVKKPPSEYLVDHVRLATQPLERPENDAHLLQMFEMMNAKSLLMFSSDYPHWDFDSPTRAFPRLDDSLHSAIFSENARAFYGLK